jgi:hypothetical protein
VIELVGISQVFTVPGQKKITLVIGSERKMKRIAQRILWHKPVSDIAFNDFGNWIVDLQ